MLVPFVSLDRENSALRAPLEAAARRVIESGHVLYGPELEAFEHEIAEWHGIKYAVGCASGTDSLEIALRATHRSGVVTTTAMTAPATANAIEAAGCEIALLDPSPVTRNATTTADVAVHLYGLATECRSGAIEDIAHSMGATVDGKLAGTMGLVGAASFYPTKTMGALGDGGCLLTNDAGIAERARAIRHYGFNEDRTDIVTRGQNSRLCELQAAFLRVKLPHVHDWISRRREIAARYTQELKGRLVTPYEPEGCRGVYHVYAVEHPKRDWFKAALQALGVTTIAHYPRAIHQYDRWKGLGEPGAFPVAEKLAATVLSLPCYPGLTSEEQDWVIRAVKECT